MTNTNLLKKKIEKSGLKIYFIAQKLGITYQSLLNKINNKTEFVASEIEKLSALLHLTDEDRKQIFFMSAQQEGEQDETDR